MKVISGPKSNKAVDNKEATKGKECRDDQKKAADDKKTLSGKKTKKHVDACGKKNRPPRNEVTKRKGTRDFHHGRHSHPEGRKATDIVWHFQMPESS